MQNRVLGRTGWQVSEISCGTYKTFDVTGSSGQAKVVKLMQANLELDINLFDSAPMYGQSESNIGQALGSGKLKEMDKAWVATKLAARRGGRQTADRPFLLGDWRAH